MISEYQADEDNPGGNPANGAGCGTIVAGILVFLWFIEFLQRC